MDSQKGEEKEVSKKQTQDELKEKLNEIKETNIDNIIEAEHIKSLKELNKPQIKNKNAVYANFKLREIYGHTQQEIKELNRNVVKELVHNLYVAEKHNFILEHEEKIIASSGKLYDKSLSDMKARIATCMIRWAGFNGIHDINRFIKPNIKFLDEWMKSYSSEFPEIKGFNMRPVQFLNSLCDSTLLVRMKRMNKNSEYYCLILMNNPCELTKEKTEDIETYNKRFAELAENMGNFKQVKYTVNCLNWAIKIDETDKKSSFEKPTGKFYYRIQGNNSID